MSEGDFLVSCDETTGLVRSVRLYGRELLDSSAPCSSPLHVNGRPLRTRRVAERISRDSDPALSARFRGECFTDHFSGWGLYVTRDMGLREYASHPVFGINLTVRRDAAEMVDLPCPGPGGPVVEAPLFVDSLSVLNWNWQFWGEQTRMIFLSSHSNGPTDEFGHVGYENDTPEKAKQYMRNVWRRIYPGVMVIPGGLYYNAETGDWLAITCRRAQVGFILNLETAGRGVAYDFTLHVPFQPNDFLRLPEIKLYYGDTREGMWEFLAEFATHYYQQPAEWLYRTVFAHGLAWNNEPTWGRQADQWERLVDDGTCSGISYSLVTNRPVRSGTTPFGYEPDPNHGTKEEFRACCRRLADRNVPFFTWMSHSGMTVGAPEVDDDWFIRGIDGRLCGSWGDEGVAMYHINPGHPGYIDYTRRWIDFYIGECGAKGIFLDCLGWAFPPDYRPRAFMRHPGDTNVMAIRFMEAIHEHVKRVDPEAVVLGEGTSLDGPVDVFSINSNPVRAIDGLGPRDVMQLLNRWSTKRITMDQGASFCPGLGMCTIDDRPGAEARNRRMTELLRDHGSARAFQHLPGDLSIHAEERVLVVPKSQEPRSFTLPDAWGQVGRLVSDVAAERGAFNADGEGFFTGVPTGIYRME